MNRVLQPHPVSIRVDARMVDVQKAGALPKKESGVLMAARLKAGVMVLMIALAAPVSGQQTAGTQQDRNKELVRTCLNQGPAAKTTEALKRDTCFAEQVTFQGRTVSSESLIANLDDIRTTSPDWSSEIMEIVAEGDVVVVRTRVSGTHKGVGKRPINGGMLVGVPPTGKRFEVQHIRWYKIRDGKIVEHYAVRDDIGMMRQLGLLPPLPAPK